MFISVLARVLLVPTVVCTLTKLEVKLVSLELLGRCKNMLMVVANLNCAG